MTILRPGAALLLLCLAMAGCATLPPTARTPQLPPNLYGLYEDNDAGAINFAAWAFASPARLRGDPVNATRAVIAVEYLAGELRENPRWVEMSPIAKQEMAEARTDLRHVLGIQPGVSPQEVVNVMLAVGWNLRFGHQAAALRALTAPGFTLPPEQTLQVLANLPYIRSANLAGLDAEQQMFPAVSR